MDDLIYAEQYTNQMQDDILFVFPCAIFEDASDFLHRGRFGVSVDVDDSVWELQMFMLGIYSFSFHMQMLRLNKPDRYIEKMRVAVDIVKSKSKSDGE